MRGLSTRNYGAVVKDFHQAYGVEKSAVSDNFIASSREKLQGLMERPLGELRLCAVLIDGTPFRDRQMIVALGINSDGRKTVLGLREGATENATVVTELLSDLAARGLDFSVPRLYVLDGSKALAAALHRELMELNPSAARNLEEGMEETLTVHRLRVPAQLRRTLASTNVIESAFSIVETVCRNVKRWRTGDHIERWVGSGLLVAERQFRKVQGYREIPSLLTALANTVSKKAVAEEVKVA
jgi:putative transposase